MPEADSPLANRSVRLRRSGLTTPIIDKSFDTNIPILLYSPRTSYSETSEKPYKMSF